MVWWWCHHLGRIYNHGWVIVSKWQEWMPSFIGMAYISQVRHSLFVITMIPNTCTISRTTFLMCFESLSLQTRSKWVSHEAQTVVKSSAIFQSKCLTSCCLNSFMWWCICCDGALINCSTQHGWSSFQCVGRCPTKMEVLWLGWTHCPPPYLIDEISSVIRWLH